MCRAELSLNRFGTYLVNQVDKKGASGFPYIPLGSLVIHFLKDIKPFERYVMDSRILTWNEKWVFTLTVIRVGNRVCSISVAKMVFKNGRITIRPKEIIEGCGYDLKALEDVRARNFKLVTEIVDATELLDLKFK
ncbi:unnamed protein product [Ambrosiozyma monospora]|uniref:Unnamed protein product n=1 Tax=Ambrosiozyma monospora TaxID=43982 RepID=A0A9W6Z0R5_AMBMO|nr:unnamed protein product [Ambrosiozyma monospora]